MTHALVDIRIVVANVRFTANMDGPEEEEGRVTKHAKDNNLRASQ